MDWIKDIGKDEIRSGFLVTTDRKKVWQVEMSLLEKFRSICKKHDLKWYAGYGTLLGAVRHKGFIPWDDDIDVLMMRPDYERFKAIAAQELSEPFFLQNSYTDSFLMAFSKIRDSRTTGIEFIDDPNMHQGIFLDIFPLDDVPDKQSQRLDSIKQIQYELWATIVSPQQIDAYVSDGGNSRVSGELLQRLCRMPAAERMEQFETFCSDHFGKSSRVNFITEELLDITPSWQRDWFAETMEVPFEQGSIVIPKEYDKILTESYGDYMQFVKGKTDHEGIILSADIPYRQYFREVLLKQ
ncbi:lipopolysaccharide cholinephosphotransferase [Selenomonas sp. GACV-9]|uniref:LicD family protein n=1 Tax=Selenomonas sp. GACV-9 TaxID=3158782 RepID=UPI0008E3D186|nr:lipopolysaccharide cholinephosphotransferase [Selenomonas ruminantium]